MPQRKMLIHTFIHLLPQTCMSSLYLARLHLHSSVNLLHQICTDVADKAISQKVRLLGCVCKNCENCGNPTACPLKPLDAVSCVGHVGQGPCFSALCLFPTNHPFAFVCRCLLLCRMCRTGSSRPGIAHL